jgi:hypothetical protein
MTTKLVYHTPGATGQVSPFDTAISRVAEGKNVDIACPYLTIGYLRRVALLAKNWRLLTDMNAWVASQNPAERGEIITFLAQFTDHVRHYPRLHAKVIVSPEEAMVGSANLTSSGVQNNVEMAVSITDATLVRELQDWFDDYWKLAVVVPLESVRSKIGTCPVPPPAAKLDPESAESFPAIAATLVPLESEKPKPEDGEGKDYSSNAEYRARLKALGIRIRIPQARILIALLESKTGILTLDELVHLAPVDRAWGAEYLGQLDPERRAKCDAKTGHPSLLSLGYVQKDGTGKGRLWTLTEEGRKIADQINGDKGDIGIFRKNPNVPFIPAGSAPGGAGSADPGDQVR